MLSRSRGTPLSLYTIVPIAAAPPWSHRRRYPVRCLACCLRHRRITIFQPRRRTQFPIAAVAPMHWLRPSILLCSLFSGARTHCTTISLDFGRWTFAFLALARRLCHRHLFHRRYSSAPASPSPPPSTPPAPSPLFMLSFRNVIVSCYYQMHTDMGDERGIRLRCICLGDATLRGSRMSARGRCSKVSEPCFARSSLSIARSSVSAASVFAY